MSPAYIDVPLSIPTAGCGIQCLGNSDHGVTLYQGPYGLRDDDYDLFPADDWIETKIQQMMFVSGETGEPSVEVTTLIEIIAQEQVHEMVSEADDQLYRC